MKILIKLIKNGSPIYEGVHIVTGAQDFGEAFMAVWDALHTSRLERTTSVGELMSVISEDVLDDINGSSVLIERL